MSSAFDIKLRGSRLLEGPARREGFDARPVVIKPNVAEAEEILERELPARTQFSLPRANLRDEREGSSSSPWGLAAP